MVINKTQTNIANMQQRLEEDALVSFADKFQMDKVVNVAVTVPRFKRTQSLRNWPSIYQTEMHAIETCAQKFFKRGTRSDTF